MDDFIKTYLSDLEKSSSRRHLRHFDGIDFSSNDFLKLANHAKIKRASIDAIKAYGTSSSASRLVTGNLSLHDKLEKDLAHFMRKEAALLFSTGYAANMNVIDCLPKHTEIFIDRACHASIYDGLRYAGFSFKRYDHNDLSHCEKLLAKSQEAAILEPSQESPRLIITESIFSMDGDRSDLAALIALKEKYHCLLMVDEAHAIGLFGDNLSGLSAELGLQDEIDFIVGTFGKGVGSFGAFVACSALYREWLINNARGFIFSTALPPAVLGATQQAIELLPSLQSRAERVLNSAKYFRNLLNKAGVSTLDSTSHIVPVLVGENQAALDLANTLQEKGFIVLAMRPPTVPPGTARLRVVIQYGQTHSALKQLAQIILDHLN